MLHTETIKGTFKLNPYYFVEFGLFDTEQTVLINLNKAAFFLSEIDNDTLAKIFENTFGKVYRCFFDEYLSRLENSNNKYLSALNFLVDNSFWFSTLKEAIQEHINKES